MPAGTVTEKVLPEPRPPGTSVWPESRTATAPPVGRPPSSRVPPAGTVKVNQAASAVPVPAVSPPAVRISEREVGVAGVPGAKGSAVPALRLPARGPAVGVRMEDRVKGRVSPELSDTHTR